MTQIVKFIRDRLQEDEDSARAASAGPWTVDDPTYVEAIYGPNDYAVVAGGRWGDEASVFEANEDAIHIARYNPERALREVEAKRAIVFQHDEVECCATCLDDVDGCPTFRALAYVYAGHPEYQDHWKP